MAKIYGDETVLKRAQSAAAGDRSVYVNWDAINDMPEEFEAVVSEVAYNPKDLGALFSNVGTKDAPMWQPTPELMYKIAEACGVSGSEASESSPIVETVDINPMLCKGIEEQPTFRQMIVGRSVSKRSCRTQEDGSLIWSSQCTSEYNVWERCLEAWSKEEQYTEGYTQKGKYPPKYDTMYKRRAHFDSEMKFAHAKAETKAHVKTVRELAGLPTGYKPDDLKSGSMVFYRIRRSQKILKLESAARLHAISNGAGMGSAKKLFALPDAAPLDAPLDAEQVPPNAEPAIDVPLTMPDEPPAATLAPENEIPKLARALMSYLDDHTGETREKMDNAISWILKDPAYESNTRYYQRALDLLKQVESTVPAEYRFPHDLY